MSIIRSNIARQLLAEGGAPRTPFSRGGQGRDRDVQMSGVAPSSPSTTGFEESPEMGGRGTTTTYGFNQGDDTPQDDFKTRSLQNQIDLELGLKNFRSMLNPFAKPELPPEFYYNKDMFNEDLDQYGLSGKSLERIGNLQKGLDTFKDTGKLSQSDFEKAFFGPGGKPPKGEGGDNEPIKKLRAPIAEKTEEPKGEFDDLLKFYGARFEDGGEVRQNYGLGSIVKKATRAVKKVAKSPIGKAALFAGLGAYGLGAGPFKGVAGSGFLKGPLAKKLFLSDPTKGFALSNINPFTAILGTSLGAGLLSKQDEEEEDTIQTSGSDPEFQKYLAFYGGPRRFAEKGGDIEDAPMKDMPKQEMASYGYNEAMADTYDSYLDMKKKGLIPPTMDFDEFLQEVVPEMSKKQGIERTMAAEGGMMDLGGNEMDLRGGGFVPLGAKEKADDVPARLSKNEFVFTADAVRAAGGGSVDKGADVMYKTMKTLENKVA